MVLDYVAHKLSLVRHELLHMWRTFLACWDVWGGTLLYIIFLPLLFWGCISYGIYSVPFLVLCTIRLLCVGPMTLYRLAYCELLLLPLVGITVFGCN